jgi:hypothetical protein
MMVLEFGVCSVYSEGVGRNSLFGKEKQMPPSSAILAATLPVTTISAHRPRRRFRDAPLRVWEQPLVYEDEGRERLVRGAVSVAADAWWSAALSVPEGDDQSPDDTVFVRFERHGASPAGYRGSAEADLSFPRSEIGAIVVLLAGIVDQARRTGALSA